MRTPGEQERHAIRGAELRAEAEARGLTLAQYVRSTAPAARHAWDKTWAGFGEKTRLALCLIAGADVDPAAPFTSYPWPVQCALGATAQRIGRELAGVDVRLP